MYEPQMRILLSGPSSAITVTVSLVLSRPDSRTKWLCQPRVSNVLAAFGQAGVLAGGMLQDKGATSLTG